MSNELKKKTFATHFGINNRPPVWAGAVDF
jgi:hypothetical protein